MVKLNDWVSDSALGDRDMAKKFIEAEPFRHIFIENFLKPLKEKELFDSLKKEEFEEKESDLFQFFQTADLGFSENKVIQDFWKFFAGAEFQKFLEKVTGLKLTEREMSMSGTCYVSGSFLICHDDEIENRKIAYILYLGEDFGEGDGGEFALYSSQNNRPKEIVKKYSPKPGALLLFEVSKESFHSVEEVLLDKKRWAVGGWFS